MVNAKFKHAILIQKLKLRVRTTNYECELRTTSANRARTTREQRTNNARTAYEQRANYHANYERELTRELRGAPVWRAAAPGFPCLTHI